MKNHPRLGALILLTSLAAGCGGSPASEPTTVVAMDPAPVGVSKPSPPIQHKSGPLVMQPVGKVATLMGLYRSSGHVELCVGYHPGGGQMGSGFWFIPLVNGQADLTQQTKMMSVVATIGGEFDIFGRRPDVYFHSASGFRSGINDYYSTLLPKQKSNANVATLDDESYGYEIAAWANGSLLEWRGQATGFSGETMELKFRLVQGKAGPLPSIPAELQKQLKENGFTFATVSIAPSGYVIAAGKDWDKPLLTTLVWQPGKQHPEVVLTRSIAADASVTLLGGETRNNSYATFDDRIVRLSETGWQDVGDLSDPEPPDMWFGEPLLMAMKSGTFVRLAKGAPWRKVEVPAEHAEKANQFSYEVDEAGVVWTHTDEVLLASEKPSKPFQDITIAQLMETRAAAGLEVPNPMNKYSDSPFNVVPKEEAPPP